MLISDKTIRTIKDNVDCRNLIKSFGIKYNRQNISCSEINQATKIKILQWLFIMITIPLFFSCGFNADAIKIVQKKFKPYSFNEAVEYICKITIFRLNIKIRNMKVVQKKLDIIEKYGIYLKKLK